MSRRKKNRQRRQPRESAPGRYLAPLSFGKHKGAPLETVPHDYLRWVLKELHRLPGKVRFDIECVLAGRNNEHMKSPPAPSVPWDYEGNPGAIESLLKPSDIPF